MPAYTSADLPWYEYLSIDLLLRVAKSTFLNPVLVWLYPFALRAQAFHWHMRPLQYGVAFAVLVDLCWLLILLDKWGRNGRLSGNQRSDIDRIDDVVVITGGASGLGQIVAEMFALKGISVAVLDSKRPSLEENYSLQFYECDVSDIEAVKQVAARIEDDVLSKCCIS